MLSRQRVSIFLHIVLAATFRAALGKVLLVVYEKTEPDMLSLFEENLG